MKKLLQKLKEKNLILDTINVILGIVMIVAIVVTVKRSSGIAMLITIWSAGLMNVVNGVKIMLKKGQKMLGQSMVFMGILVVVAGTLLLFSGTK